MNIHRSRFVPYPTSAISALAFSRSSDSGYAPPPPALRLAIGRADGSIEIWNPLRGLWVQETVFPGDDRGVDGLVWTQDPDDSDANGQTIVGQQRLFSIASSPAVTEWDLATGTSKRKSTGNFSEVWCFAAQPRRLPHKSATEERRAQDIVAGCGDGSLVLLSTADDDLQFKRYLARVSGKKARCMCVTYQSANTVVAGFADSIIRVYDTRNGSVVRNMSLGVGIPGAPKNALVWQVMCLPNGDIVSGDSNGEVRFWDGRNYALTQRLHGHDSDCLDLVCSADGKTVFAGSIDGKLAVFKLSSDGKRRSWAKSSHRRVHSGEVKAMAAFDSKGMSVVVSGGSDVAPILTPLREFGTENLRWLPSVPQDSPVASAPKARLLVSWWAKTISVWRIARLANTQSSPESERPRKLVAKITLNTKLNIRSATVSADGRLVVAATSSEIKAFQLRRHSATKTFSVRAVDLPKGFAALGARLLQLSPDGKWLAAVTPDSEVHMARFAQHPEQLKHLCCVPGTFELDRRHLKPAFQSGLKDYDRTILRLAFASDSSVLVVGDISGCLDPWVLEGHEDLTAPAVDFASKDSDDGSSAAGSDSSSDSSDDDDRVCVIYGQHWTDNPNSHLLPRLDSAPLVLTFRPPRPGAQHALVNGNPGVHATRHNPHAHSHELPVGQHRLWIMTAKHQMYEFDVLAGKMSEWSKRNPTAVLPEDFRKIRDRAMGAVWDVNPDRERLWLYGSSWLFMLDVGKDLHDGIVPSPKKRKAKRKAGVEDDEEMDEAAKRRHVESGAGGRVDEGRNGNDARVAKRFENGQWTDVPLNQRRKRAEEEDLDDDDGDVGMQLTRVRSSGDEREVVKQDGDAERRWWCTFKYRPKLGMVPLADEEGTSPNQLLEVALVERPLWETRDLGST